jgi:hypothetical protein
MFCAGDEAVLMVYSLPLMVTTIPSREALCEFLTNAMAMAEDSGLLRKTALAFLDILAFVIKQSYVNYVLEGIFASNLL